MFDKDKADYAVNFINCLKHTKGKWRGVPFELLPWQDEIIRTVEILEEVDEEMHDLDYITEEEYA